MFNFYEVKKIISFQESTPLGVTRDKDTNYAGGFTFLIIHLYCIAMIFYHKMTDLSQIYTFNQRWHFYPQMAHLSQNYPISGH